MLAVASQSFRLEHSTIVCQAPSVIASYSLTFKDNFRLLTHARLIMASGPCKLSGIRAFAHSKVLGVNLPRLRRADLG